MNKIIKVLDKGFVSLVDYMGNDDAIVQAARVSYGEGTKTKREDRGLIRYLLRNEHMSPFEMVEFKFHMKMPLFVARQLVRHRTASMNEISGRYSILKDEAYVPENEQIKTQSTNNKQGRGESLRSGLAEQIKNDFIFEQDTSFNNYNNYILDNVARELARINLPLSTYTEMYWKMDLRNLMNFLKLRLDSHAQYEIRVYAEAIFTLIEDIMPVTMEAFKDYVLESKIFSKQEVKALREIIEYFFQGPQDTMLSKDWIEVISKIKGI